MPIFQGSTHSISALLICGMTYFGSKCYFLYFLNYNICHKNLENKDQWWYPIILYPQIIFINILNYMHY